MSEASKTNPSSHQWILVTDPSEAVQQACVAAAKARDLECRIAKDVPEAIKMVYSQKPAAILLTMGLPVMPGSALVAALNASTSHRVIPIGAIISSEAARKRFEAYEPTAFIERNEDLEAAVGGFLDGIGLLPAEEKASESEPSQRSLRVLLAEDSPTSQLILARMLHVGGADVTVVENGEEAIAAVETTDFEIILMDIEMPKMNGLEAAALLRARGIEVPIIAVTGHEEENISSEEFDDNFDGFLQKPVSKNDVNNLFRLYRRRLRRAG